MTDWMTSVFVAAAALALGRWYRGRDGIKSLVRRLDARGFYRYADTEGAARAKHEALQKGWLFGDDTRRGYRADSEDLAEGGVPELLGELRPFLERQGARWSTLDQSHGTEEYVVRVDGRPYPMYSKGETSEDSWELATRRAVALINDLLGRAGSAERAYWLYGGNDTLVVFLTPEMFDAVRRSPALPPREKPQEGG